MVLTIAFYVVPCLITFYIIGHLWVIYKQIDKTRFQLENELYKNRQELSQFLHQGLQTIDQKISHIETRFHHQFQVNTLQSDQQFQQFQHNMSQLLTQVQKLDQQIESKLTENLKEGFAHFEKIQKHLTEAYIKLSDLEKMSDSIHGLHQILKMPHLRGSFGEAELERILADFLPKASYALQVSICPDSAERVDAVVRFQKQLLPIDSKFPREQILPLFEHAQEAELQHARKQLYTWIKAQAKTIAAKYIHPEYGTTDIAFLFLPSEMLYFEVVRNVECFQSITKNKVFPVSPNTLAMSLHAIRIAISSYETAEHVHKTIEDLQKAKKYFETFGLKFEDLGKGLRKTQEAFDVASRYFNSYQTSVFKLEQHGTTPGDSHVIQ
jgi:DNA recombination protein RmuC